MTSRKPPKVIVAGLLLGSFFAYGTQVIADSGKMGININPTRLEIGAGALSAAVTLINTSDAEELFQIQQFAWAQQDNKDKLTPTEDLVIAPPVVTIQPGETRVVRIALRGDAPSSREATYRVIVAQVPRKVNTANGVQLVYHLSLPLFVDPTAHAVPKATWSARPSADKKHAIVTLDNQGEAHVRLQTIRLLEGDAEMGSWREGSHDRNDG